LFLDHQRDDIAGVKLLDMAVIIAQRNIAFATDHPKPLQYQYTIRDAVPWVDRPSDNPFSVEPETDISRYAIGREWDAMRRPGVQSTKYFSLVRPALDRPAPTLTATAGQTGAAGICHPLERRKFSIAEAKRLGGFPDDFKFCGTYQEQFERIGRCVPPVMMSHIAAAVRDGVLRPCRLRSRPSNRTRRCSTRSRTCRNRSTSSA